MNLLLDTHALLWWLDEPTRLAQQARAAIEEPGNVVFVSAAVAWEMSTKHAAGKLRCPDDLESVMEQNNFRPLAVSIRHALSAGALPAYHTDPFDRLLVAQAQAEGLRLVTRDSAMPAYGVAILAAKERGASRRILAFRRVKHPSLRGTDSDQWCGQRNLFCRKLP